MKSRLRWDVHARFPGNASGVRVGIRTTYERAQRYAELFARRNQMRLDRLTISSRWEQVLP